MTRYRLGLLVLGCETEARRVESLDDAHDRATGIGTIGGRLSRMRIPR
jgi:hypothetical protein